MFGSKFETINRLKPVNVMYLLLYSTIFIHIGVVKNEYFTHNMTVNDISDKILDIFDVKDDYGRIKQLKEKLVQINNFDINNDKYEEILSNVTRETELNKTNFYEALKENDHFRFLTNNNSNNLYLKLKSKMNRDNILKLLAVQSEKSKIMKSARKMLKNAIPETRNDERMNDMVDKLLSEIPRDNHKSKAEESIYWDPQGELEHLKEYYESKHDARRIFKGVKTSIRDYPFMVSLHIMGRFWCGGALYWSDLVITSAACLQLLYNNRFFRENPKVLQVRLGSNHSRIGGEVVDVLEVYFHPSYNPRTLRNNLAVVRLRRHLAFSYHRVPKIIAISDIPTSIPATADITVLGWGVTKMTQKLSLEPIFLQKKNLPVYPNTFCKEIYGSNFITNQMFCAGTFTTGEGACDHDAGGPAILSGRLVGVISFGPALCGAPNTPTVFTLVGAFSDWLESVNQSMPSYYQGRVPTTTTPESLLNDFFVTWRNPRLEHKETARPKLVPIMTTEPTTTTVITETTTPVVETATATEETTETSPVPPPVMRMDDSDGGWSIETSE